MNNKAHEGHDHNREHDSDKNDHNHGAGGHNHNDWVSRLLGPRAEVIFAGLAGLCLLFGWLGPKLNILPESIGFGFLIAAYFFGGYFALREALGKIFKGQFQIDCLTSAPVAQIWV